MLNLMKRRKLIKTFKRAYKYLQEDGAILFINHKHDDMIEITTIEQFIDVISTNTILTKEQIKRLIIK